MELGRKIAEYYGDELYDELDVTRADYETMPACEFYEKVKDSCLELHPEVIDAITASEKEPDPEPWKTFDDGKEAKEFLKEFAKSHFYLCVDILEDIFYHDYEYRIYPSTGFLDIREIWWNRAKEEGREGFLDRVKHGKDTELWGTYTLNSVRALARKIAPSNCARYCWRKGILRKENGKYVVWDGDMLTRRP